MNADNRHRVTLPRVIRSEWTKLRSLRSTWWSLATTVFITVAAGGLIGRTSAQAIRDGDIPAGPQTAIETSLFGVDIAALILGVYGVLLMTGEYGTGQIRASLTAVPKRLPVLWAKAIVFTAVVGPLMLVTNFAAFLLAQALAGDVGVSLSEPGVVRAIFGATGYLVGIGLLCLGIGVVLRNLVFAITVYIGVLMMLPPVLAAALPADSGDKVGKYTPMFAGGAMYSVDGGGGPIPYLRPGPGALVLAAYVVLVVAAGAVLLRRRDV
ncbi:ABC transporter permease [Phytomonospora endophytica]|uniref:ABC-type transport system involved in multi-copper enzyme maturation permease subunit n=1 Tax=Phytomonospora endophytica TaxID=714109 RepID=A0A841FR89_9ACTN|nr:ABC transporter permease [Phytomonospora endophytica]MBB6035069.1 ABC-type transport system involved in multi-copper enzyme maturation permease subunit [Phytomonospora endophytica]GIG64184.1 ABC transporter permease [Phytomonospora endophytica]